MKKLPRPWFRPARGVWYVTLDGVQHNLGPDEEAARKRYFELLVRRPSAAACRATNSQTVAALIDGFLVWCQKHWTARSHVWYQTRLQSFLLSIPRDLLVSELKPFHLTQWIDAHPAWNDTTRWSPSHESTKSRAAGNCLLCGFAACCRGSRRRRGRPVAERLLLPPIPEWREPAGKSKGFPSKCITS